jgi:hypothetical protein
MSDFPKNMMNPIWVMFFERESGSPYFYNIETHETVWEDPSPEDGVFPPQSSDEESPEDNPYLLSEVEGSIDTGIPPYLSPIWKSRPARRQVARDSLNVAYREGQDSYNSWYHKYNSDRFDAHVIEPSTTHCDPWLDSGVTKADDKNSESSSFCMWFAKGACYKGSECRHRHRIPSRDDDRSIEPTHDVFGRKRHADHKNDMGGVGSFLKECRCVYVSDIVLDRSSPDCVQKSEAQLWRLFHPFGPIESIRIIPNKVIAFIKFEYRAAAEFAKVACSNQPLGLSPAINVRWAFEDPNPRVDEQLVIDTRIAFYSHVERRIAIMSHDERKKLGLLDNSVKERE